VSDDLFSFVAEQLEQSTPLDRIESRGTIRIALKMAGLERQSTTPEQFCVIVERILPDELKKRGVTEVHAVCPALIAKVRSEPEDRWERSPEVDEVFVRLARAE
jgi:hypothetical protein